MDLQFAGGELGDNCSTTAACMINTNLTRLPNTSVGVDEITLPPKRRPPRAKLRLVAEVRIPHHAVTGRGESEFHCWASSSARRVRAVRMQPAGMTS